MTGLQGGACWEVATSRVFPCIPTTYNYYMNHEPSGFNLKEDYMGSIPSLPPSKKMTEQDRKDNELKMSMAKDLLKSFISDGVFQSSSSELKNPEWANDFVDNVCDLSEQIFNRFNNGNNKITTTDLRVNVK